MTAGPAAVSREQLLAWTREMALIRRVEELAAKAYTQRKILGFCHLYIGQEAVSVGACAAIEQDDHVVTAYRDHGVAISRGISSRLMMAELFGKTDGINHGVGGSMHMGSAKHNLLGGFGIVGAHVPLATGAAFAVKYRGEDRVALAFFGDGAANQGAFFEALALAQLWQLPAIFLCENNQYAMGTSVERQSFLTDMSRRGQGVGMRRAQFDGHDVLEVYRHVREAVELARAGHGPSILEATTYRYRGHSMSDPAKYRADGELEEYKSRDCIQGAIDVLLADHGVTEKEIEAMRAEIEEIAQDAYAFAEASPAPDPAKLYDYVYAPTSAEDA